jgi:hypothetical protein
MRRLTRAIGVFSLAAAAAVAADQMESKRAAEDVSADTNPNSGFWRAAPHVFAERDTNGDAVAGYRMEVRSRWTARSLYFLFTCPYVQLFLKPDPKTEIETNQLWKWDVAEVFIGSDFKNIRKYKEFEVSPQAEWVDLDIDLDAPHHEGGWTWNSGFQASARVDATNKTWYAFMRIPYTAVDSRTAARGNILRVNLFLSEGAQPNHKSIVWQPTHRPSFHTPEVFGELKLVD